MIEEGTGFYAVPSSVKVVLLAGGNVLLGLNDRNEWELPGGWPDREDTSLADTAVREVREESGLDVPTSGVELIGAELWQPVPDKQVVLVTMSAKLDHAQPPRSSDEHSDVRWFSIADLPANLPQVYRRFIDAALIS